jgi:hypothetical protein
VSYERLATESLATHNKTWVTLAVRQVLVGASLRIAVELLSATEAAQIAYAIRVSGLLLSHSCREALASLAHNQLYTGTTNLIKTTTSLSQIDIPQQPTSVPQVYCLILAAVQTIQQPTSHTIMSTAVPFAQYALRPIIRGLKTISHVVSKGEVHAKAQGIDPSEYTTASIHPDMKDFVFQVCRFTDAAKFVPWRVNPENSSLSLPDVEKTFPELLARIQKVTEYLESIDEKTFEGREMSEVIIAFPHRGMQFKFTAAEYVMMYAHPNFW